VEDADRATLLLFFEAVLGFARQIVGLKAADAGGTAMAAVVVAVAEVVGAPPVEEVEDADRAALLLFFEAVLGFARQIVGLKAEDIEKTAEAAVVAVL
jgi:hypothetical protein